MLLTELYGITVFYFFLKFYILHKYQYKDILIKYMNSTIKKFSQSWKEYAWLKWCSLVGEALKNK